MSVVCGHIKRLEVPLLLGLALQCSVLMTVGIRVENVSVPNLGLVGQSARLECHYALEEDTLYSLKWYKDSNEFYRLTYSNSKPNIQTFNLNGIDVDNQELHNLQRVTLRRLSLNSSGVFKCEVTSSTPFFQTVFQERKLNVIIPPNPPNPHLSKFSQTVYMHDILNGNCTSYRSYPAANLTFYINDRKWTGQNVTMYEAFQEKDRADGKELWTSVLGLKVRVNNNLFNRGIIRIKCKASIYGREWETLKNITHHNKNYQPPLYSSARNSSASSIRWSLGYGWNFPLFFIFALGSGIYTIVFYATVYNVDDVF